MNYQNIHDSIIERARLRTDKLDGVLYHLHHVLPRHEGGLVDSEMVSLTIKEHYIIHHLRYKITKTIGNKLAWLLLKGMKYEVQLLINSEAGKLGGIYARDNKIGIFSPDYDRGKQSRFNWSSGIMDHIDLSAAGKIGGSITRLKNLGIFREDLQHLRTEWAMVGANALQEAGTRSGICSKEWRENNKEFVFENASKGGKIGGKIVGDMFWWNNGTINKKSIECPEGFVRGMLMSEKKKAQIYEKFHSNLKCKYCDREDTNKIIINHQIYCFNNPNRKVTETFKCEHCYKEYTKGNYTKFHGNNCKNNKNKEETKNG